MCSSGTDFQTLSAQMPANVHHGSTLSFTPSSVGSLSVAMASEGEAPMEVLRKDYQQPSYWIREVTLTVRIFDGRTEAKGKASREIP